MTIYVVYKATNTINGKSYIGFCSRWPSRQQEHINESYRIKSACYNTHFHRAIRKHSPNAFSWEILYQSNNGEHTLKVMEPHFISEYNTFYNGYNQTLGGDGSLGRKHSLETIEKIRYKRQFQKCSNETRKKMSKAKKGIPKSESTKQKMQNNKNALGAKYTRKHFKIISPQNEVFIAAGYKELEKYVPNWVVRITKKNGGSIKEGRYKGWAAFIIS